MSGIVLSASVRQNLLSLQSTAALLATTQNDLATGNKVNSALDNPTEFFTAQGLNNRASDISNLLDGIGNGVQVLQAANTGITSLQSLIANAQSIANQVLQAPTGYTTKSTVTSTAIPGATASNLLGPGTNATTAPGTTIKNDNTTSVDITAATQLVGTASGTSNDLATAITTDRSSPSMARPSPSAPRRPRRRPMAPATSPSAPVRAARRPCRPSLARSTGSPAPPPPRRSMVPAKLILSTGHDAEPGHRRHGQRARRARPQRRNDQRHSPRDHRSDAADRCHRRRHANQHHVRHRRRPGLDAQPAQYSISGE